MQAIEGLQRSSDQQPNRERTKARTSPLERIRRGLLSTLIGLGLLVSPEMAAPLQAAPPPEAPTPTLPLPAENVVSVEAEVKEYREALHTFAVQVVAEMNQSPFKITNGELTATIAQLMEQNHTTTLASQVREDTVKVVEAYIDNLMVVGNRPNYPGQSDSAIFQAEAAKFSPEYAFRFYTVIQEVRSKFAQEAALYNQKHTNEPWKNVNPQNPTHHPQGYPTPARGAFLTLLERAEAESTLELTSTEIKMLVLILQMAPEHFSSFLRENEGRAALAGNGILGYLNEVQFRYVFQRDSAQFTDLINSLYDWPRMEPTLQKKYQADRQAVTMNQDTLERAIKSATDQAKKDAPK